MDPQAQAQQRIGVTLCHKWTLEKLIGVGGMAAVYVAVHKIGRREAIKILHADVAQVPDIRARFEQEAQVVNRFRHPGAVEIRDIDVAEDGSPFLVMELLEGESLGQRAQRLGGIELVELLRFTDELLDVLTAAHSAGIIHRDIKLDNLFIQRDGRLKVLDFGIARVRAGLPLPMQTQLGATLGTAPYMPPEQIKGLEIDARADLFAVGATLFRIIANRRLHEAANETDLLLKMATEPPPPLLAVAAGTPPDLALVVDRALMYQRERRYPDAATMQGDVRALRSGLRPPYALARLREPDSPRSGVTLGAPQATKTPPPDGAMGVSPRAASLSSEASSEAPTRVGVSPANAAGTPLPPEATIRIGGDVGTRPTVPAPPNAEASRVTSLIEPATIQRPGPRAVVRGAEQTLQSAQAPVISPSVAKPVAVSVEAPSAAAPAKPLGPTGAMGTVLMAAPMRGPAATGVSPTEVGPAHPAPRGQAPMATVAIVPAPPFKPRRRLLPLLLAGGAFVLLGAGALLWVFSAELFESGSASNDAANPSPESSAGARGRPRSATTTPAPARSNKTSRPTR